MSDLSGLGIAEARDRLAAGELTSRALTEACLSALDGAAALNAVCHRTADRAMQMAEAADRRRAAGESGAMLGIPVGVKDLFCTEGVETQAASRILQGFRPPYESTVTRKLWEGGAVLAAKLSMDEFAMGSSTETACYGPCVSPWRRQGEATPITPGGSSGGSSAVVAAGLVPCALGTDTGGSIRQPAALTGIVGMKPTYGRCSRWGIVAFASSLDQAGPLARSVRDTAILLGAMAGHDPMDSTSADLPVPDFEAIAGHRPPGQAHRRAGRVPRGPGRRDRALLAGGHRHACAIQAARSSRSACRTPNTRCPPTTSSRLPRRRRTSPAMTACAMATGQAGPGRRHRRDVREDPRRGFRARGCGGAC